MKTDASLLNWADSYDYNHTEPVPFNAKGNSFCDNTNLDVFVGEVTVYQPLEL